jgi:hypothetical protein
VRHGGDLRQRYGVRHAVDSYEDPEALAADDLAGDAGSYSRAATVAAQLDRTASAARPRALRSSLHDVSDGQGSANAA